MDILRQTELRSNIKKYFDIVSRGGAYLIPQKKEQDIVIISKREYEQLLRCKEYTERMLKKDQSIKEQEFIETDLEDIAVDDWSGLMQIAASFVDDPTFVRHDPGQEKERDGF